MNYMGCYLCESERYVNGFSVMQNGTFTPKVRKFTGMVIKFKVVWIGLDLFDFDLQQVDNVSDYRLLKLSNCNSFDALIYYSESIQKGEPTI